MKKQLLFIFLILAGTQAFSQAIDEIRFYYGRSDSEFFRDANFVGGGSNNVESYNEAGIKFVRFIDRYSKVAVTAGLNYSEAKVTITPEFIGRPVQSRTETFNMLSVPVNLNVVVWRYFFANFGPVVDFQNSSNSFASQSGIGYNIGIGARYYFNDFMLFINPNFKRHVLIPFHPRSDPPKLSELGVQIGVGIRL